jgi:hypothetical protein
MPHAHNYSQQEFLNLLLASEGRNSPVSGEPGHCRSLHIGQDGMQISDRLQGKLSSDATHPIIMGPGGSVVPENQSREIWRGLNPGTKTADLKNAYSSFIDNAKSNSGAFLDLQQALVLGRYTLNCATGQGELAKLDLAAVPTRVRIQIDLNGIMSAEGAWKMNFATTANDITHVCDFNHVFMLLDRIDGANMHLQTFYPIK